MSKHTYLSSVVILIVWAPDRFEVEHVEIDILWKVIKKLNRNFSFGMCEGAELSVLALHTLINVRLTELSLVLVWVVEFLYSIVCFLALITIDAFLVLCHEPTQL